MVNDEVQVRFELEGWALLFARLERQPFEERQLTQLRRDSVGEARQRWQLEGLASDPTVAALRKLFRAAGCDPTRYRPSSEALLRRILKGGELPAISPLVDLNNCLSLALAVPCCVMAAAEVSSPYVLRAGAPGEDYESLKGPFNLEGKPLLVDRHGPCDAPITGSRRVMIGDKTQQAWLVAYLPGAVLTPRQAGEVLDGLLRRAPIASISGRHYRPADTEEA
jgi:DNA/RNA-binding domain of Phe-tRNA-synthetase-like protein